MAYPVLANIYRAQIILHYSTGLPEDVAVNNLYFHDPSGTLTDEEVAEDIQFTLDNFFGVLPTGGNFPVKNYIGNTVNTATYKVYDLGQAAPRFPIVPEIDANWFPPANNRLPLEVACCLSFKSGNLARDKGRIYIGPLSDQANDAGGIPKPAAGFMDDLARAASEHLMNTPHPIVWVQVSPTYAEWNPVLEGWVDNAYDTQRSRGQAATSRQRYDATGLIV